MAGLREVPKRCGYSPANEVQCCYDQGHGGDHDPVWIRWPKYAAHPNDESERLREAEKRFVALMEAQEQGFLRFKTALLHCGVDERVIKQAESMVDEVVAVTSPAAEDRALLEPSVPRYPKAGECEHTNCRITAENICTLCNSQVQIDPTSGRFVTAPCDQWFTCREEHYGFRHINGNSSYGTHAHQCTEPAPKLFDKFHKHRFADPEERCWHWHGPNNDDYCRADLKAHFDNALGHQFESRNNTAGPSSEVREADVRADIKAIRSRQLNDAVLRLTEEAYQLGWKDGFESRTDPKARG